MYTIGKRIIYFLKSCFDYFIVFLSFLKELLSNPELLILTFLIVSQIIYLRLRFEFRKLQK